MVLAMIHSYNSLLGARRFWYPCPGYACRHQPTKLPPAVPAFYNTHDIRGRMFIDPCLRHVHDQSLFSLTHQWDKSNVATELFNPSRRVLCSVTIHKTLFSQKLHRLSVGGVFYGYSPGWYIVARKRLCPVELRDIEWKRKTNPCAGPCGNSDSYGARGGLCS